MIISVTGTPGVGKTTLSKLLAKRLGYEYVSIKEFAVEKGIGTKVGNELEIDVEKLAEAMSREFRGKNVIIDGHLSHFVPADLVIVLRAHPRLIAERLKERGYPEEKLAENIEAEFVDVVLVEAIGENENVLEIDTSGKEPEEVLDEVLSLIHAGIRRRVGVVDWSSSYEEILPYLRVRA